MEDSQSSGSNPTEVILNKLTDMQSKLSSVNDMYLELKANMKAQQESNDKMFQELADANKKIRNMTAKDVVSSIKEDKEMLSSFRQGFTQLEDELKSQEFEAFKVKLYEETERLKHIFPRVNG